MRIDSSVDEDVVQVYRNDFGEDGLNLGRKRNFRRVTELESLSAWVHFEINTKNCGSIFRPCKLNCSLRGSMKIFLAAAVHLVFTFFKHSARNMLWMI